ncbi:MAG: cyclopropane-fatty-acyl-phospholipid synthase family protein [Myxococcales bacterium]
MTRLADFVVFHDPAVAARYAHDKIPMTTLFEAYLDNQADIPDMEAFLDARGDLVRYTLTEDHVKFFFTRFIPEVAIHSKKQDERIVRDHYDRGDDFFEFFLGDRMVYTSGIFTDEKQPLEAAQDRKIDLVCQKLMLEKGERLLDIGCGWGTLALRAAKVWGADSTGVTIAKNQTAFGNRRIEQAGVKDRARILCSDYRDIPRQKFDKISSLEMVEHVGVKNLPAFFDLVYDLLSDDGLFLLQWTGLRRGGAQGVPVIGLRPEDLIWGLFMNKYIFAGADASLPLSEMVKAMEKAGFEVQSAENVSIHYALTIQRWHQNWVARRAEVLATYGERWYRLWHLFLAWSWRIARQGNAACFQIVANKNLDSFDRTRFVGYEMGRAVQKPEAPAQVFPPASNFIESPVRTATAA